MDSKQGSVHGFEVRSWMDSEQGYLGVYLMESKRGHFSWIRGNGNSMDTNSITWRDSKRGHRDGVEVNGVEAGWSRWLMDSNMMGSN